MYNSENNLTKLTGQEKRRVATYSKLATRGKENLKSLIKALYAMENQVTETGDLVVVAYSNRPDAKEFISNIIRAVRLYSDEDVKFLSDDYSDNRTVVLSVHGRRLVISAVAYGETYFKKYSPGMAVEINPTEASAIFNEGGPGSLWLSDLWSVKYSLSLQDRYSYDKQEYKKLKETGSYSTTDRGIPESLPKEPV